MGKSPGKWIKNLFGKKPTKSIVDKRRATGSGNSKNGNTGKEHVSATDSEVKIEPTHNLVNGINPNLQTNASDVELKDQSSATVSISVVSDKTNEECAAAQNSFLDLKGIIRLQALVRGHLTRRQALATLHCTWGIIKLQSLVRGSITRKSSQFKTTQNSYIPKVGFSDKSWASGNAFARKLVSLSISEKALGFDYGREEPNSAFSWLDRWTESEFWKPILRPKKPADPRSRGPRYAMETESGRTKRIIRMTNGVIASADSGVANLRKPPSYSPEVDSENPQSELERVKRNLRRVTGKPMPDLPSARPETELEKKPKAIIQASDESAYMAEADLFFSATKAFSLEEEAVEEKPKSAERRASFSGLKLDIPENVAQHTPKLPSYMAATQSAKAKLRGHISPRVGSEEAGHAAFTRRHSLPTPINGKLGSASPRTHRSILPGVKSGTRTDRSLMSSRDGKDKPVLVEWRR